MNYDVAIIGSGVSGAAIARTLSRYETVTRLEEQNGGGYLAYITGTALDEAEYYDNTEFELLGSEYNAEFSTSYGSFSYDKNHIGFEIDIVYPNGVYNSDSSTGDFQARNTTINIILKNSNISVTKVKTTAGEQDNSPIRVTYKYIYADNGHATVQSDMHLSFKRVTPEPTDIQSNDKREDNSYPWGKK